MQQREAATISREDNTDLYPVDFDTAMGKGSGYFRQVQRYQGINAEFYARFKEIYNLNNLSVIPHGQTPGTPKIVHQIWIGTRPLPEQLRAYRETWLNVMPKWEHKLWTNKEVAEYKFVDPRLEELFSRSLTIGERVDILKYDIILKHGGVYADTDCVCLRPFDILAENYDFFGGILPPFFAYQFPALIVQNCLFAARASHPIIRKTASLVAENWDSMNAQFQGDDTATTLGRTFLWLTSAVKSEALKDGNRDIAFPPTFFFPQTAFPMLDFAIRGPIESLFTRLKGKRGPYSFIREYSFSQHYSSKEWMHDLFPTMKLKTGHIWTVLSAKDWRSYLRAKLIPSDKQKVIPRETFEQLLERANKTESTVKR
ncbi:MAG TPA: glycosyltransferase [Terriglobales bacterium]|nr:glycosyltransferase [Terriglobales bacterium]